MKNSSGMTEASLLGLLFVAASIFRGGNRQIAIALLLLISLALLSVILADLAARRLTATDESANGQRETTSTKAWRHILLGIVLLSPIYIGALQTLPIFPVGLSRFSPDVFGPPIRDVLSSWPLATGIAFSTIPDATILSALCGLVISIALWSTIRIRMRFLSSIVFVWILVVAIQLSMVVLQIAGGPGSWSYFNSDYQQYKFIGTFNSRNTLGGFFASTMPLVVWFCMFKHRTEGRASSTHWAAMSFCFAALAGMTILIFGMQSRGGLLAFATSAIAMVVVIWAARSREFESSHGFVVLMLGLALTFSLVAISLVGWETVSQRFRVEEVARPILFATAWDGAIKLLPFGAGLGTFGSVYPEFQPVELAGYFSLAHNDYIQYVFELGFFGVIPAAALITLTVATFIADRAHGGRSANSSHFFILRHCAIAGLLALMFHSTVEFNMHIPALALLGAFLTGIVLKPLWNNSD